MSSNTPTFQEYLDSSKLNYDVVVDALTFIADAHPIFKNSLVLQDILNGKNKDITGADLSSITKTALLHSMLISRKAMSLQPNQQLKIAAEISILNSAVSHINNIRLQLLQDTLSRLSEIEHLRRYSKGEI